jgi:chromosome segregation ATPase
MCYKRVDELEAEVERLQRVISEASTPVIELRREVERLQRNQNNLLGVNEKLAAESGRMQAERDEARTTADRFIDQDGPAIRAVVERLREELEALKEDLKREQEYIGQIEAESDVFKAEVEGLRAAEKVWRKNQAHDAQRAADAEREVETLRAEKLSLQKMLTERDHELTKALAEGEERVAEALAERQYREVVVKVKRLRKTVQRKGEALREAQDAVGRLRAELNDNTSGSEYDDRRIQELTAVVNEAIATPHGTPHCFLVNILRGAR